ncbi:MAG: hypothetical protein R3C01_03130 [Planctomycetaceae bacterium]
MAKTPINPRLALGFDPETDPAVRERNRQELRRYINLKLAAHGQPIAPAAGGAELIELASGLLANFDEKTRLLDDYRCPADRRIEQFLNAYCADVLKPGESMQLPGRTLILDRHGIAREMSLPAGGDLFEGGHVTSYRVQNGVLHNPLSDRRTTQGTFHIVDGGLPIAGDKVVVPKRAFVELFRRAMSPPQSLLRLPFTSEQAEESQQAHCWASLMLRPLVSPEVPGASPALSMETRFFAPGTFVSNLDFVESIFGNAGDPFLPENDAALDVAHWSGHTGCVILATHLLEVRKRDLGLPHYDDADESLRKHGMCWKTEDELYNNGQPYKLTCRDASGVAVTIITDNYFGYCKKEVKTQISFATNLMGNAEEEHSGGALVFPSFSLGDTFQVNSKRHNNRTFNDVARDYSAWIDVKPEGYGIDKNFNRLYYIPENAEANLRLQTVSWSQAGKTRSIPLLPGRVYMAPSGYKLRIEKHPAAPSWRLIGTGGEGVVCHKPCTVSGGGKSEISKSLIDYMEYGSIFVSDVASDFDQIQEIFERTYEDRWTPEAYEKQDYKKFESRKILNPRRSLGSVIKLLTPNEEYNDVYNQWLKKIPEHLYALIFAIKRFHNPEWGDDWRRHFSVDVVNGSSGHELKLGERKLVGTYLRVGLTEANGWRTFKCRQDFAAAAKVQTEDDISVSTVVPSERLGKIPGYLQAIPDGFLKFVANCEYRLFQRPDDAIHRGFDKQAEADLARREVNFISNFEPITRDQVLDMQTKAIEFDAYTEPMKALLRSVGEQESGYVVCSDNPRKIGDRVTKNPRYLQDRADMVDPFDRYLAEMGTRLWRKAQPSQPVHLPVTSVLAGRRNNPPDAAAGIRSLAVFGPIHYQELPELFMDTICSLTGKSPSTTGAGSEGALTKGPFNSLRPAADLNAALVSAILTGLGGFSSAAGHIGPNCRFDHDISLLVPEVWCRMDEQERSPEYLINNRFLEKVEDVMLGDEVVPARRLGYRITKRFVRRFFARIFDNPDKVFDEEILKPEKQDPVSYADGVQYIMEAYKRVAQQYFEDGTIDECVPPLQALLHVMADGEFNGKDETAPEFRAMFTREAMLSSDWYKDRLVARQQRDVEHWQQAVRYIDAALGDPGLLEGPFRDEVAANRTFAVEQLALVESPDYLDSLQGTIGRQPDLASR